MVDEKKLRLLLRDSNYRDVNEDFIYDAFDIISASVPQAKNYLNQVHVVHGGQDDTFGSYFLDSKDIIIWIDQLLKLDTSNSIKHQFCLATIRHEIEHAASFAKYMEEKSDIESCVIRITYAKDKVDDRILNVGSETYGESYECNPKERIAEIRAREFTKKLYRNMKNSPELVTAKVFLLLAYLRGYKSNGCYYEAPTYRFFETQLINRPELMIEYFTMKKVFESTGYCFHTRLLCGLPISNEEYNYLFSQLPEFVQKEYSSINGIFRSRS